MDIIKVFPSELHGYQKIERYFDIFDQECADFKDLLHEAWAILNVLKDDAFHSEKTFQVINEAQRESTIASKDGHRKAPDVCISIQTSFIDTTESVDVSVSRIDGTDSLSTIDNSLFEQTNDPAHITLPEKIFENAVPPKENPAIPIANKGDDIIIDSEIKNEQSGMMTSKAPIPCQDISIQTSLIDKTQVTTRSHDVDTTKNQSLLDETDILSKLHMRDRKRQSIANNVTRSPCQESPFEIISSLESTTFLCNPNDTNIDKDFVRKLGKQCPTVRNEKTMNASNEETYSMFMNPSDTCIDYKLLDKVRMNVLEEDEALHINPNDTNLEYSFYPTKRVTRQMEKKRKERSISLAIAKNMSQDVSKSEIASSLLSKEGIQSVNIQEQVCPEEEDDIVDFHISECSLVLLKSTTESDRLKKCLPVSLTKMGKLKRGRSKKRRKICMPSVHRTSSDFRYTYTCYSMLRDDQAPASAKKLRTLSELQRLNGAENKWKYQPTPMKESQVSKRAVIAKGVALKAKPSDKETAKNETKVSKTTKKKVAENLSRREVKSSKKPKKESKVIENSTGQKTRQTGSTRKDTASNKSESGTNQVSRPETRTTKSLRKRNTGNPIAPATEVAEERRSGRGNTREMKDSVKAKVKSRKRVSSETSQTGKKKQKLDENNAQIVSRQTRASRRNKSNPSVSSLAPAAQATRKKMENAEAKRKKKTPNKNIRSKSKKKSASQTEVVSNEIVKELIPVETDDTSASKKKMQTEIFMTSVEESSSISDVTNTTVIEAPVTSTYLSKLRLSSLTVRINSTANTSALLDKSGFTLPKPFEMEPPRTRGKPPIVPKKVKTPCLSTNHVSRLPCETTQSFVARKKKLFNKRANRLSTPEHNKPMNSTVQNLTGESFRAVPDLSAIMNSRRRIRDDKLRNTSFGVPPELVELMKDIQSSRSELS